LLEELAAVTAAAAELHGREVPEPARSPAAAVTPGEEHRRAAAGLGEDGLILLGQIACRHPRFADLRVLAAALAELTGAGLGYVSEGANAAGAALAGVLPHRAAAGVRRERPGRHAGSLLAEPPRAVLLMGADPDEDFGADARSALARSEFVVALTPYRTTGIEAAADVMLPLGTAFETAGTYVNGEGRIQSFAGVATPVGEARPGWKILRVIGNMLDAPRFDYLSAEDVREEALGAIGQPAGDNAYAGGHVCEEPAESGEAVLDVPIYRVDALVRHAHALQLTADGRAGRNYPDEETDALEAAG
jgi:NADH-quinone oxidoreductase subunit G